jgi:hypothetical protein
VSQQIIYPSLQGPFPQYRFISSNHAPLWYNSRVGVINENTISQAYKSVVLSHAPTGYWRLSDGNNQLVDQVSGNNATIFGTTYTTQVTGLLNFDSDQALQLNGDASDTWITIPYTPTLNTTSFSVEVWFKLNGFLPGGVNNPVINNADPTYTPNGQIGWRAYITGVGGHFSVEFSQSNAPASILQFIDTPFVSLHTTYHYVFTFDGNTFLTNMYRNGSLTTMSSQPPITSSLVLNTISPMRFASNHMIPTGPAGPNFSDHLLKGVIDEFAVYNYALTPLQVASHYQAGSTSVTADSLVKTYFAVRVPSESNPTSELTASSYTGSRSPSDVLTAATDALAQSFRNVMRNISDALISATAAVARGVVRTPQESTTTSESVVRVAGSVRSIPEVLTAATDAVVRLFTGLSINFSISESLSPATDQIIRGVRPFIAETLSVVDSVIKDTGRKVTESNVATDAVVRLKTILRFVSESLTPAVDVISEFLGDIVLTVTTQIRNFIFNAIGRP